ncbi:MAG: galactose-1-phosphate uridylyltransferase [bacterium]
MPQLRKDPIIGRWVIIATARAKRPQDFNHLSEEKPEITAEGPCPFCPGHEHLDKEIIAYRKGGPPNSPNWWVRVIPDKYPVVKREGPLNKYGEGMYDRMEGVGSHEIVICSPEHNITLAELPVSQFREILWAYRERFLALKLEKYIKHILVVHNYGRQAGGWMRHPHSQLVALPVIPKTIKEETEGARRYYKYKERCIYCDIIREEMRSPQERVIFKDHSFIALTPFASRSPFEVCILPRRHSPSFEEIKESEITKLAEIMKNILEQIKNVLDDPSYNLILHSAPFAKSPLPYYHWHIEIKPALVHLAGFEWGTGFYINPTPPEEAAKYLRGD